MSNYQEDLVPSIQWDESLDPRLRTLQIIVCALVFGLTMFIGVSVFMRSSIARPAKEGEPSGGFPIVYVAFALTAVLLTARLFVPGIVDAAGRRKMLTAEAAPAIGSEEQSGSLAAFFGLQSMYETRTIVGAALLEGPAFFAIIVFMLEGSMAALILGIVLGAGIASHFPTRDRTLAWMEKQLRLMRDERGASRC